MKRGCSDVQTLLSVHVKCEKNERKKTRLSDDANGLRPRASRTRVNNVSKRAPFETARKHERFATNLSTVGAPHSSCTRYDVIEYVFDESEICVKYNDYGSRTTTKTVRVPPLPRDGRSVGFVRYHPTAFHRRPACVCPFTCPRPRHAVGSSADSPFRKPRRPGW